MPKRTGSSPTSTSEKSGTIMQFKVWLLGLSPMVWRRVHVPATFTLRQLHGVIQVAMGWDGVHLFQFRLRATHYGWLNSHWLCSRPRDRTYHEHMRRAWTIKFIRHG